jgi:hypothetical protein
MRTRASRGSNKALGVATDQFETTSDAVQPPINTIEAQVVAGEFLLQVCDFAMQVADLRLDGAESRDGFIKSLAEAILACPEGTQVFEN